ncbi:MAG: GyrI-like domain-containing protein [Candidatus Cloacimonadota bacterium]|nr:MAG: GyrI-like domain-containing protein [Candidatus Cloacimonadota bacterium]
MSASYRKGMLLLLAVFVVFLLFSCAEKPQEKAPEPTKTEITTKDMDAITVVYLDKKGPYSETEKAMEELFVLMGKKNLKMRNQPMGAYYDDPEKVPPEETKYEVLSQFIGEFKGDDELKVKEIPAQKVAMVLYTGPYEKCEPIYKELYSWIAKNNYEPCGPSMEKYLNDPRKIKPEELKTEILIPIKLKAEEKPEK